MEGTRTASESITPSVIDTVCERYRAGRAIRQPLPGGGELNIDRPVPFICVYRRNPRREDAGTEQFVTAEASFLSAPGLASERCGLRQLVQQLAKSASDQLGGFLIIEIWSAENPAPLPPTENGELQLPRAAFCLHATPAQYPDKTIAELEFALQQITLHGEPATVIISEAGDTGPFGLRPWMSPAQLAKTNTYVIGLEVQPVYRDSTTGALHHAVLQHLRSAVAHALHKAFFAFAMAQTRLRPLHHYAMGRKSFPQQVWKVDRQLAAVSSDLDFLLQCTPINTESARQAFAASNYRHAPVFHYRPLETAPLLLKRKLLAIRTERVTDPVLSHVLRSTQDDLDRQVTMLSDIGTSRFLPGSLQVFGAVEPRLRDLALQILHNLPRTDTTGRKLIGARAFLRLARKEIDYYRAQCPGFAATASIKKDMYSGLLVTNGHLVIGRETSIPADRAQALLQHEVGTHLVTYYNGSAQPMHLLKVGLAGYDGLQEGLAVLSEYLAGGLDNSRLRILAARVIAADDMVRGGSFADIYRRLNSDFGFETRSAYTITMRIFRGGGLTKDLVYLRGLTEILEYIADGGDIEPLFLGKIASDHIAMVKELQARGVLRKPPVRPRCLDSRKARVRLERLRCKASVLTLAEA